MLGTRGFVPLPTCSLFRTPSPPAVNPPSPPLFSFFSSCRARFQVYLWGRGSSCCEQSRSWLDAVDGSSCHVILPRLILICRRPRQLMRGSETPRPAPAPHPASPCLPHLPHPACPHPASPCLTLPRPHPHSPSPSPSARGTQRRGPVAVKLHDHQGCHVCLPTPPPPLLCPNGMRPRRWKIKLPPLPCLAWAQAAF